MVWTSVETNSERDELLAAARGLRPAIVAASGEIERSRRLPIALLRSMADAHLFQLFTPRSWGGLEVDPVTALTVIEEVAAANGSAGWLAVTNAGGLFTAWLDETQQCTIDVARPDTIIAGALVPTGAAVAVPGGYRVSGRWAFVSGIEHAAWLVAGCTVANASCPDSPYVRAVFLPAASLEIVDTWSVSGLCGTGSHDVVARNVYVPAAQSFVPSDPPVQRGCLYSVPVRSIGAAGLAAVALGIAQSAIDALVALAATRAPTSGQGLLHDRPMVQVQVAQAEARTRAGRAFLYTAMAELWASVHAEQPPTTERLALVRLAATHAATGAAEAVDLMWSAGGGSALYASSPIGRAFRDVHAATQHASIQSAMYEPIGRALLGVAASGTAPSLIELLLF